MGKRGKPFTVLRDGYTGTSLDWKIQAAGEAQPAHEGA